MTHEDIEFVIRAGLGREEWVLLISFPDNVGGNPSVVKFSGTRNDALAEAKKRIDNWVRRQKETSRLILADLTLPTLLNNPRFLPQRGSFLPQNENPRPGV